MLATRADRLEAAQRAHRRPRRPDRRAVRRRAAGRRPRVLAAARRGPRHRAGPAGPDVPGRRDPRLGSRARPGRARLRRHRVRHPARSVSTSRRAGQRAAGRARHGGRAPRRRPRGPRGAHDHRPRRRPGAGSWPGPTPTCSGSSTGCSPPTASSGPRRSSRWTPRSRARLLPLVADATADGRRDAGKGVRQRDRSPQPAARHHRTVHRAPALRLLASALVVGLSAVALAPTTAAAAASAPLSPTDQRIHDRLATRSTDSRLGPDLAGLVTDLRDRPDDLVLPPRRAPAPGEQRQAAHRGQRAGGLRPGPPVPDHRGRRRHQPPGRPRRQRRPVAVPGRPAPAGHPDRGGGHRGRHRLGPGRRRRLAVPQAPAGARLEVRVPHLRGLARARAGRRPAPAVGHQPRRRAGLRRRPGAQGPRRPPVGVPGHRTGRRGDHRRRCPATTWPPPSPTCCSTSDNDVAEGLHRLVALQTGYRPTWPGAAAAQVAGLARLGITLPTGTVYDGSGLSRRRPPEPARPGRRAAVPPSTRPTRRWPRCSRARSRWPASAARWPRTTGATSPPRPAARPG